MPPFISPSKPSHRRGAALLTVLVAMMIISILLFEFQYSAMVERKLAYNQLNQLQAYYLAKAGARIGLLRVALYGRARKDPTLKNIIPGVDIGPYLESIWNLPFPAFPPEAGTVQKMVKADRDAAEKVLEETRITEGQYTHVITSESSKINLNYLQVPASQRSDRISFTDQPKTLFEYVGKMLIQLMENFLRESEDPYEEYGNLKPEEIVFNIMDWVTPGDNSFAGGSKDAFYEQQRPPYKAKRNRLYTVEELKLVKGIDNHLFEKLRPYVTVYSYDGKINLNTATPTIYKVLYRDFNDDDVKRIIEERDKNKGWASVGAFVDFVKNSLGRSGFSSYYSDENNYPFTVNSQSFLIESLGMLKRSKSSITRTIRVGVALTAAKGGTVDTSISSESECKKKNMIWVTITSQCKSPPTTQQECINAFAGQWFQNDKGAYCCKYPSGATGDYPTFCSSDPQKGPDGKPVKFEASAMKVLYWMES